MKKVTKLCGTKKTFVLMSNDDKIELLKNLTYICKKCQKESKDKMFLCYPEIKK